jgi:hypothetical protein
LALGIGEVLTYSIVANNPLNAFTINSMSGQLSADGSSMAVRMPANDIPPQYSVMIGIHDAGIDGPVYWAFYNMTINVTAVHFPPTLTPYNFSIPELSTNGTVVGTVSATSLTTSSLLTMSYSIAPSTYYSNFPFYITSSPLGPGGTMVGVITIAQGAAVGTFSAGPKVSWVLCAVTVIFRVPTPSS